MPSLIGMLKDLFKTPAELSRLEQAIFDSVRAELGPREALLWDKQLAAINRVHRHPDGKEINLYSMRGGKSDFPREICFEKFEEFKIAVIDVIAASAKLRGRVWCVNGHVFSIEYKTSFKDFEKHAGGDWTIHCHIESLPI